MNNQIQMRIDNVNLKPECTHFMAQYAWSAYTPQMRALHEILRIFLADYSKSADVAIRLKHSSDTINGKYIVETYEMAVGSEMVASFTLQEGGTIPDITQYEMSQASDIIGLYDTFAKYCHGGVYDEVKTNMVAQTLLHPLRPLLASLLTAASTGKLAADVAETHNGKKFGAALWINDDNEHLIQIEFRSPAMEMAEATS